MVLQQEKFFNNVNYRSFDFLWNKDNKVASLKIIDGDNVISYMNIYAVIEEFIEESTNSKKIDVIKYYIEYDIYNLKLDMFYLDNLFERHLNVDIKKMDKLFEDAVLEDVDFDEELTVYWKNIFYYLFHSNINYLMNDKMIIDESEINVDLIKEFNQYFK